MATEPPRQRAGKSYPGGKILRKAHTRLASRRQGHYNGALQKAFKMPGSMK